MLASCHLRLLQHLGVLHRTYEVGRGGVQAAWEKPPGRPPVSGRRANLAQPCVAAALREHLRERFFLTVLEP